MNYLTRKLFLVLLCFVFFITLSFAKEYSKELTFLSESFNSSANLQAAENNDDFQDNNDTVMSDDAKEETQKACSLSDYIAREQRYLNKLDSMNMLEYPVGLVSSGSDLNYTICLDKDEIDKSGTHLSAYMAFGIPQTKDTLAFAAKDIPLNANGGLTGDIKLELISNKLIYFGNYIRLKILGGEGNSYVLFGCDGFKSMKITAEVQFSSSVFLCEDPSTGEILDGKMLTATFSTTIYDWNDLMVELSISPFQIKGIPGFGFDVKKIVMDFSDYNNPVGITFPKDYKSSYFTDGNQNLWRGFYIQEATVRLPAEFKKQTSDNSSSARISFSAYNMLIDNQGFTGSFDINNILSLEEGDMSGWSFSVDKFHLAIEANCLKEAGFSGKLAVPVIDSALLYSAIIGMNGDYSFTATTTKKNSFNMWVADLDLYPNSTIEVKSENGNFKAKAILNGKMTINASITGNEGKETDKSKSISLADITFENFQIQTEVPYIKSGVFSFGSGQLQQAMAGFPISIQNITATLTDETGSLGMDITLGLTDSKSGGFSATGGITIIGERKIINNRTYWKYKTTEISQIAIDLDCGPIKMNGTLIFFKQNPVYGNGFQGNINAEFSMGIKASANAIFGKIRSTQYWYADALTSVNSGIPIFTGFAIYGFGGGAYYHMKQTATGPASGDVQNSSSGIVYVPDSTSYLGLKASVVIGTNPSKLPFNGDVGFEIAFNVNMGVRYIAFSGHGYFMTPPQPDATNKIKAGCKKIGEMGDGTPDKDPDAARAQIYADVYISYDFDNDVLQGNLKVYVNVANIIKGVNDNNLAGEAVLYFDRKDWYIYIGTPETPIGISIMGMFDTKSYFMVGTKILDSPPPPENVSSILSGIDLDYMKELNSLGTGQGIAFGSRFSFDTGDLTFLIFYARFAAGMGFDVMLKNYGNATCSGSTDRIGINGWYANGQVFGYLEGKIGIKIKIFGFSKKADILSLGIAAILQAKLPNPLWMKGVVGGYFSAFGGLVSGHCNFEFTIGNDCKIVGGSVLSNINVISKITPQDGSKDISVFNKPQAVFNYQINKSFEMVDVDNIKKTFRVNLDYFTINDGSNNVPGSQEWNADNTVLAIKSFDVLPGKKTLKASVQVSFEEFKDGIWQAVLDSGRKITENQTVSFETGAAPDYIPLDNVVYSYPIINQMNYYKDESYIGYIKLDRGQPYLFDVTNDWVQKGRFTSINTNNQYYFNFTYDASNREVDFTRPANLPNNEIMKFELVNVPASAAKSIDANVSSVKTKVSDTTTGSDLTVKTQTAEGSIQELKEKNIYTSYFRTSSYSTFSQKLDASVNKDGWAWPIRVNVEVLYLTLNVTETFDKFEIYGQSSNPLIQLQADLSNNNWYNNIMYPVIYKDYPITTILTVSDTMGIPPVNALYVYQDNDSKVLTDDDVSNGNTEAISQYTSFAFNLPNYMDNDLYELKNKIANNYLGKFTQRMSVVLNGKMILLAPGVYKLTAKYILPGKNIVTSTIPMNIRFLL